MMANDKQFLHAWIIEKLQESNENNFVELLEIKKKYNSDVTQHIWNLARFQAELFPVSDYHIDVVVFSVPLIEVETG
jgi:hypothetical protein